jgi:hypothetical protein
MFFFSFRVIIVAALHMQNFKWPHTVPSIPPNKEEDKSSSRHHLFLWYLCSSYSILLVHLSSILLSNHTFGIPGEQRTIRSMVVDIGGDCRGIVIVNVQECGDCHKEGLHPSPDEAVAREGA